MKDETQVDARLIVAAIVNSTDMEKATAISKRMAVFLNDDMGPQQNSNVIMALLFLLATKIKEADPDLGSDEFAAAIGIVLASMLASVDRTVAKEKAS